MEDDSNGKNPEMPKDMIVYYHNQEELSKEIIEMINQIFSNIQSSSMNHIEFVDNPIKKYENNVIPVDFTKKKEGE